MGSLVHISTDVQPTPEQLIKIEKFSRLVALQVVAGKPIRISEDHPVPPCVDPCDFTGDSDYIPQLLEQQSVVEKGTIKKLCKNISSHLKLEIKISDIARWELNQGKEKEVGDLAADVKSLLE